MGLLAPLLLSFIAFWVSMRSATTANIVFGVGVTLALLVSILSGALLSKQAEREGAAHQAPAKPPPLVRVHPRN